MIEFKIQGDPVGKGRPRATSIGGRARMYTPSKTVAYEQIVMAEYAAAGGQMLSGPVAVRIVAMFKMPKSWSEKRRKEMDGCSCEKKPDGDNIAKVICDGLNGIAYRDDSCVADLSVRKQWANVGCVYVDLWEIERIK